MFVRAYICRYNNIHTYIHTYIHTCVCTYIHPYMYNIYIYIYGHPPKIYTCRLHTISCLCAHMCTLVITTDTTVNIGVFRGCPRMHTTLLLSSWFGHTDKSAAECRSTNRTLYVFGEPKLSEGTHVICCGAQKLLVFLHFSVVKEP